VESGQNPLVKECYDLIPIIIVGEGEKWREQGKGDEGRIIPVMCVSGNSFVISLNIPQFKETLEATRIRNCLQTVEVDENICRKT
jgi:hypothetical protein